MKNSGAGQQDGAGSDSDSDSGSGSGSVAGPRPFTVSGPAPGTGSEGHGTSADATFDHERLEVYRVAREFFVLARKMLDRKMPRELQDQFGRATMSILFNIGEGAGKTARDEKRRFYEIARGSTTEAATQLDVMQILGAISDAQYSAARSLLLRVAQMLSRLCANPRFAPDSSVSRHRP